MKNKEKNRDLPGSRKSILTGACLPKVIVVFFFLGIVGHTLFLASGRFLLLPESGARWIRYPQPTRPLTYRPALLENFFRYRFDTAGPPPGAILSFRATNSVSIFIDGRQVYAPAPGSKARPERQAVDISNFLTAGPHDFVFRVKNNNGFPALLAYCEALGLATGSHWQAGIEGGPWLPAMPLEHMTPPALSRQFQRTDHIFAAQWWRYAPVFLLIFTVSCLGRRRPGILLPFRSVLTPGNVRWSLLVAWLMLAANNLGKLPLDLGFDAPAHLDYIRYVAQNGRIPFAGEGWEMFQPPLFYLVAAILYKAAAGLFAPDMAIRMVRVIPLLCGAAQVEITYRLLRCAYPLRNDRQVLGILIGGMLPMNLYLSQAIGNEPLAGFFSQIVILLTFNWLSEMTVRGKYQLAAIGLFAGLAVLTKVTALILIPVAAAFIALRTLQGHTPFADRITTSIRRASILCGIVAAVAGWYYLRNFMEMGRFFAVGGWDVTGRIVWWQEPGFRTLRQLTSFGEALFYPVYSGMMSLWDSLYSTLWLDGFLSGKIVYESRPPWNYQPLLMSAWLSLPLTVAIVAGLFRTLATSVKPPRTGFLFLSACLLGYGAAFFYLFMTLPVYSTGKATYLIGISPCLVIFCLEGFELVSNVAPLRRAVYGLVGCWALASYLAYFVR